MSFCSASIALSRRRARGSSSTTATFISTRQLERDGNGDERAPRRGGRQLEGTHAREHRGQSGARAAESDALAAVALGWWTDAIVAHAQDQAATVASGGHIDVPGTAPRGDT